MSRLSMDPKMAKEIQRSPQMLYEQGGSAFLAEWGGPANYQKLAHASPNARLVYKAVAQGISDESQIELYTGLSKVELEASLKSLKDSGLVITTVPSEISEEKIL